ncbi:4408_t:CDS:1, partial [Entrophospora sp. SA101]
MNIHAAARMYYDDIGLDSTGHLDLASDESIFRKLNKLNESETEIRLLLGAWHTSKAMCGTLLTIFSGYGIYNLAANLG